MQCAHVAPDRARLLRPMHPSNHVMIPSDQPHDIVSNHLVLIRIDIVDPADMESDTCKYRFPSSNWVRTNDRMRWRKFISNIQW